jgi:RHS repeat-associated protein
VNAAFQTALPEHLPLAASPQLAENSRLGFEPVASTSRWGFSFAISSHTLGLSGSLYDGRVRSRSTGKERDTESGNDYFDARYYSSAMGRFMSPDWSAKEDPVPYAQIDDPQSLNLYSYVRNNPLTRIDPDGHFSCGGENAKGISCQFLNNWDKEHGVGQDGAQQQSSNSSSKGTGFWSHVGNLLHGHSWNYGMRESVTMRILPNFYSASAEAGPLSQSVSYVPSTNNLYYSPGAGTGSGISLTAGWATDPNGFAGGPSGSVCVFYGVGGCGGISTSGDYAGQVGVGIGGWGAAAGYGIDPVQTMINGMVEGQPADPLATNVGGIYMEDPQTWIPQN